VITSVECQTECLLVPKKISGLSLFIRTQMTCQRCRDFCEIIRRTTFANIRYHLRHRLLVTPKL